MPNGTASAQESSFFRRGSAPQLATPAGTTSPTLSFTPVPRLVSSLTSNRTPESALHPWWRAAPSVATALDQVFADLDSGQLSESLEA